MTAAPVLIDLLVLGAELEPARREGLLEDLAEVVRRHVAGAHAWSYCREVAGSDAFEDGRPMTAPHYRLHVTLPVAASASLREALAGELARRVLRTERAYPQPADLPRVAVSFGA